jgi:hypothetical protein
MRPIRAAKTATPANSTKGPSINNVYKSVGPSYCRQQHGLGSGDSREVDAVVASS